MGGEFFNFEELKTGMVNIFLKFSKTTDREPLQSLTRFKYEVVYPKDI